MITHQLITLSPLGRVTAPGHEHLPARITLPDDREPPPTPEGMAYVPVMAKPPAHDTATHTAERTLTAESDGWTVRPLTPEELAARAKALVPSAIASCDMRTIAKHTPHGNGTLHDAILAAISAMDPGIAKTRAEDVYLAGTNITRTDPIMLALAAGLGLSESTVDELFIAASNLHTLAP